jgi:hypothetical protein
VFQVATVVDGALKQAIGELEAKGQKAPDIAYLTDEPYGIPFLS